MSDEWRVLLLSGETVMVSADHPYPTQQGVAFQDASNKTLRYFAHDAIVSIYPGNLPIDHNAQNLLNDVRKIRGLPTVTLALRPPPASATTLRFTGNQVIND